MKFKGISYSDVKFFQDLKISLTGFIDVTGDFGEKVSNHTYDYANDHKCTYCHQGPF